MNSLKVNWGKLNTLGNTTEENILEFEKYRLLFEKEIKNVSTYWTGTDAVVYQSKALEFFETIKKDVDYLYEWATYFKNMSNVYNGVEQDGLQQLRNTIAMLEDDPTREIM
jgi:hypothetical protein